MKGGGNEGKESEWEAGGERMTEIGQIIPTLTALFFIDNIVFVKTISMLIFFFQFHILLEAYFCLTKGDKISMLK